MRMDDYIAEGKVTEEQCYGDARYQDVFDTLVPMLRNYQKFSSKHEFHDHPAYKAIVGLGRRVVALLLEELERNGGWEWIAALGDITGVKPYAKEDAGRYAAQRAA